MMMDREFQRGLEDCLGRIGRGHDVESCLSAYPKQADRLAPFLRAAAKLRGLRAPQPSAGGRQVARRRLLDAVVSAEPPASIARPAWIPAPLLRLGTVAAALAMFLVAAIGASAALGGGDAVKSVFDALNLPSPVGGGAGDDHPEAREFRGRVISTSQLSMALRTEDDVFIFRYRDDTDFQFANGEPATIADVVRGAEAFVVGMPIPGFDSSFNAVLVRLLEVEGPLPPPAPPEPSPEPAEPTPTPTPEEEHEDDTPPPAETPVVWTEVAFEGKVKSVANASFVLLSGDVMRTFETDGETEVVGFLSAGVFADVTGWQRDDGTFLARHVTTYPLEFWATVISVSNSGLVVKVEGQGPNVTVHKDADTAMVGSPFAGVKVIVNAHKKADGSYQAVKITVKTTEFSGAVTAKSGSTYTVSWEGSSYTVNSNGQTQVVGDPAEVGSVVTVSAYKMGDGSYLAYKIVVKDGVFSGVITEINLEIDTIWVNVGGEVREVCIEFADVVGTLEVGATVEVFLDHTEGSTYFASLVKVIG
jgi:hypothetical protein